MEPLTIALISVGLSTNVACFLFGMITGRNNAYKNIGPVGKCTRKKRAKCDKPACGTADTKLAIKSPPST
jgi:hypothetical protein